MHKLLYRVFEDHLFRVETSADITTDEFVSNVVNEFIGKVSTDGFNIPWKMKDHLIEDLKLEVLEMVRKKTYGYLTIGEYRRSHVTGTKKRES